ncbi:MCE family protein [Sciscionella sediminilitoris]|uniref:MCE family protein n=1 Tax=Sciscionella sediminilitoris TaxID=1445613 RepID=UPI0004DED0C0|nr:MCE family protein [Sciscionella sp. SE31]
MRGLLAPLIKLLAFVLVTVLATGLLALTIANATFSASSDYRARFSDVTSLNAGDDVRIAGVKVGEVSSIKIVDKDSAEIGFSVDKSVRIPASVHAAVRYRNLVGQRYVELDQGSNLDSGGDANATLKPGDVIPMDRTSPAVDLTKLFNGFSPLFQALNPQDVNKLSSEIVSVLQGEGSTVNSLLATTASLTSKIADKDAVIGKVITNLNSALTTLNAHTPQFTDLVDTVQQLVSGLAEDRKPIGDAVDTLGGLADTVSGFVGDLRDPVKKDVQQLGRFADNLNAHQPQVEHFLQYLPDKVATISRAGSYGSWFQFYSCTTKLDVRIPGLMPKPASIPIGDSTQARCRQ